MNTALQTLKGFRDFLPREAVKRKWLRDKLAVICESWGFSPLETPTLEPLEIFVGAIGEDEKLFFKFKDQGNRDVALRYDQTVPTCRVVAQYQNTITFPFKRYQIQPTFRAEKPQKGRFREFTQVDADIFGIKTPDADAETIALSLDIYKQLGFKRALVRINTRSLYKNMPYEAIVCIDKIKKIGDDGVLSEMESRGIEPTKAKEYLSYVKNLKPNEEISYILKYLKDYGFSNDWYEFDPTIARSFSYSMGPIWEVEIPDAGYNMSVLGGERYDGLVEKLAGRDIGGTGFGLGFDRTLEAAEIMKLVPVLSIAGQVLVTVFSEESRSQSQQLAAVLRKMGITVDLYPTTDKLDKQLKYADKNDIPYVVIQGPEEAINSRVKLKDMQSGQQKEMTIPEVTAFLIINS
ncbi:histidine--tRNA ligase [Patescibacteria group bacterium]|nr:histidine--tRNA ligase [Patescibacteria group bacterium]MBU1472475.1 histidine--tRNA ligase [Patescibacteria group bacterium]MBU2460289.1 histidine--tRNA ligase [Patescibacteria group bacterium]MBU2543853.1 histidine--tRNA ligase [Patescibacteria group bacterium]